MIGRVAMAALAMGLTACAGMAPAGRNAQRTSDPVMTAPAPRPTQSPATTPPAQASPAIAQPSPAPAATDAPQRPAPSVAAPHVAAPPPSTPAPTAPRPASADDDIVVPGQTQVRPPQGDPRSNEERMADIRAWDQCVIQVQSAFDADPMRPQLTTPEEYCRDSLGMAERTAVPLSRRRR